ncbi:MAG: hypothetical protein CMK98_07830 [Pseudomonas sp.]|nr:hypothetical protein [Pseudomonas sp.]
MQEHQKDTQLEAARKRYEARREAEGKEYKSTPDREFERAQSRVYSIRARIETIVSAYDCMESFGGTHDHRGIGAILINVLEACMDSLRRDGLIPLRSNEEVATRFSEITGETFKRPLVANLPAPQFANKQDDIRQVSEAIAAQLPEPLVPQDPHIQIQEFEIGDVPVTEPLEDRIFRRGSDPLVKEVAESGEPQHKHALIQTYKTLPESLWGSTTARTLFNANLQLKGLEHG